MILLTVISFVVSFLIQSLMSSYFGYIFNGLSIFFTIYVLVNLLMLKPFYEDDNKYVILIVIIGVLTDIMYSNVFLFNVCIFLLVCYVARRFYSIFPYNVFTISFCNVLCVMVYHVLSFLILYMLRYDNYSLMVLGKILYSSILMTVIYSSILYFVFNYFKDNFELREIK